MLVSCCSYFPREDHCGRDLTEDVLERPLLGIQFNRVGIFGFVLWGFYTTSLSTLSGTISASTNGVILITTPCL